MSDVINPQPKQLILKLDPTLTQRYRCVRDVVAQGVYKRGLKQTAADLDMAPGNLSVALSDDPVRKFGVDEFEEYLIKTVDRTPIYYLIERFLGDQASVRDEAIEQIRAVFAELPQMLSAAGLVPKSQKR